MLKLTSMSLSCEYMYISCVTITRRERPIDLAKSQDMRFLLNSAQISHCELYLKKRLTITKIQCNFSLICLIQYLANFFKYSVNRAFPISQKSTASQKGDEISPETVQTLLPMADEGTNTDQR